MEATQAVPRLISLQSFTCANIEEHWEAAFRRQQRAAGDYWYHTIGTMCSSSTNGRTSSTPPCYGWISSAGGEEGDGVSESNSAGVTQGNIHVRKD